MPFKINDCACAVCFVIFLDVISMGATQTRNYFILFPITNLMGERSEIAAYIISKEYFRTHVSCERYVKRKRKLWNVFTPTRGGKRPKPTFHSAHISIRLYVCCFASLLNGADHHWNISKQRPHFICKKKKNEKNRRQNWSKQGLSCSVGIGKIENNTSDWFWCINVWVRCVVVVWLCR